MILDGQLIVEYNHIVVFDCAKNLIFKIKEFFPRLHSWATPPFKFPLTKENASDILSFMEDNELTISQSDKDLLLGLKEELLIEQKKLNEILSSSYKNTNINYDFLKEGQVVRTYQEKAIEIFWEKKFLLLGDDLGLGKTYSAFASAMNKNTLPAIMVVQTHLPKQWFDKATEFSDFNVHVIKTKKMYELPEADIYIIKYTMLDGWTELFKTDFFKMSVFDEIQELRTGETSAKGKAARLLSVHTEFRLGLSATPIYNYAEEIWNIYDILKGKGTHPLGGKYEFKNEWCDGSASDKRLIVENPKELGNYLRKLFIFIRRTKEDVGQDLEPINTFTETIPYDEKTVKSIESIAIDLALTITVGEMTKRGQAAREFDIRMRQATGIAKAKHIAEYVKVFLENDEPIILTAWHREVYNILGETLKEYNPQFYTGKETLKEKEKSKKAFMEGESNLFIISNRSGAGLDGLQERCSIIVHGELDWSPEVHKQLTGRIYREGQTKQVMSIFLVSDGGSDPAIVEILGLKSSQSSGIIEGNDIERKSHSNRGRIKVLAENYLKKHNIEYKV
jgi:SNF2 family DNA or RNA helicase